jgi:hypothetical protein
MNTLPRLRPSCIVSLYLSCLPAFCLGFGRALVSPTQHVRVVSSGQHAGMAAALSHLRSREKAIVEQLSGKNTPRRRFKLLRLQGFIIERIAALQAR